MSRLLLGRPLCGFWGLYEANYGDPTTESPMRTIIPSFVGNSMLPFRCPRCKAVAQDLVCPLTREHYHDKREGRDNHFCPRCGCRFKIDMAGMPLPSVLPAGTAVGPSKVECAGKVEWQDRGDGGAILGVVLGAIFRSGLNGYEILAKGRSLM